MKPKSLEGGGGAKPYKKHSWGAEAPKPPIPYAYADETK